MRRACIWRQQASTRLRSFIGIATRAKDGRSFISLTGRPAAKWRSVNPAVDIGQIEGAFVQGMGWLTTEELVYAAKGPLLTHAPSTYKIPVASDVPADFRVAFFEGSNREATVSRSKAVGEPPLMLAISVFAAITD